jgi:hypothetical protein
LAQDRIITAAVLLAESAWIATVIGIIGLLLGGGGGPLVWLAILAIMSASLLVARGLQLIIMPTITAYAIQMIAGVVVIYLTVGAQISPDFQGIDMGWLGKLLSQSVTGEQVFRASLGSIVAVVLWLRGGHLGAVDAPVESLDTSFKIGLLAMALSAVVDIFHPADLEVYLLMFVFFASGIIGLAVGHISPASLQAVQDRAWIRVIGGVAGFVVVAGMLFSLLQKSTLTWLSGPLGFILNGIGIVIFYIFIVPIAFILNFLVGLVFNLLRAIAGEPQEEPILLDGIGGTLNALQEGNAEEPVAAFLLEILKWGGLAVIVAVALLILARAFQRRQRWRQREDENIRESVIEDADPAYDLAKLLYGILPSRLRRRRERKEGLRLPDDDQAIIDVFRIYFGMLVHAEKKGHPRPPSETPTEYQKTLETLLPVDLVRMATFAFIRACYGHHPATTDQITEMRTTLERAVSGR